MATKTKKVLTPEQKLKAQMRQLKAELAISQGEATRHYNNYMEQYKRANELAKQVENGQIEYNKVLQGECQSLAREVERLTEIIRWHSNPKTAVKSEHELQNNFRYGGVF